LRPLPSFSSFSSSPSPSAPRPLHPFPTRRSSDLVRPLLLHGIAALARHPLLARRRRARRRRSPSDPGGLGRRRSAECRSFPRDQDRKSTRLNSSHGSISYAVFCLKKKRELHYHTV